MNDKQESKSEKPLDELQLPNLLPADAPRSTACEHIQRLHAYLQSYKLEIATDPNSFLTIDCHKCGGEDLARGNRLGFEPTGG